MPQLIEINIKAKKVVVEEWMPLVGLNPQQILAKLHDGVLLGYKFGTDLLSCSKYSEKRTEEQWLLYIKSKQGWHENTQKRVVLYRVYSHGNENMTFIGTVFRQNRTSLDEFELMPGFKKWESQPSYLVVNKDVHV